MLEVRLIGKFDIQCDGKPVTIPSRIAQSLFAYLTLSAGTPHRREKLAGMFWPDASETKARAYLRHELWRIRKAISPESNCDWLRADEVNISFHTPVAFWLDVSAITALGNNASIAEMKTALSVYKGELLPGFYDDWIVLEREHLHSIYERQMASLLEKLAQEKYWSDTLDWAERWISIGQSPEAAYRALLIAYDALGDRAKVASTYERCLKALRELGLEPSEQTRALTFRRTPGHIDWLRWGWQDSSSHSSDRRCSGIKSSRSFVPGSGAS
jgi:DNA-binding SARP family transcriptional activator